MKTFTAFYLYMTLPLILLMGVALRPHPSVISKHVARYISNKARCEFLPKKSNAVLAVHFTIKVFNQCTLLTRWSTSLSKVGML